MRLSWEGPQVWGGREILNESTDQQIQRLHESLSSKPFYHLVWMSNPSRGSEGSGASKAALNHSNPCELWSWGGIAACPVGDGGASYGLGVCVFPSPPNSYIEINPSAQWDGISRGGCFERCLSHEDGISAS